MSYENSVVDFWEREEDSWEEVEVERTVVQRTTVYVRKGWHGEIDRDDILEAAKCEDDSSWDTVEVVDYSI